MFPAGVPLKCAWRPGARWIRAQVDRFTAVVLGAGDFRTRTEDRPAPPALNPGDTLMLGQLRATVERQLDHPRLVRCISMARRRRSGAGFARHGKPIQYAHVPQPLAIYDTWSAIAANPAAFEAPSAGFVLSWAAVASLAARGIGFATVTHAAGLSSTGDPRLDLALSPRRALQHSDGNCGGNQSGTDAGRAHRCRRHDCREGPGGCCLGQRQHCSPGRDSRD